MSTHTDLLRTTASDLHRFWVTVGTTTEWYSVMRECNRWFGNNWQSQNKVRKKIVKLGRDETLSVWFDVPDTKICAWLSVKYLIQVRLPQEIPSDK